MASVVTAFLLALHCVALVSPVPLFRRKSAPLQQWPNKPLDHSHLNPKPTDAVRFLRTYGYLPTPKEGLILTGKDFELALRDFQLFSGLPETGEFDVRTKLQMQRPRCGVPDKEINADFSFKTKGPLKSLRIRRKRYSLDGSHLLYNTVTYGITKYSTSRLYGASQKWQEDTMTEAIKVWEKHIPIEFQPQTRPGADPVIKIKFEQGYHYDPRPFDGSGGALAHAFYPREGSDVHFDDSEPWGPYGRNLLWVAAHEIGHSLGLRHSRTPGSLMRTEYMGYGQAEVKLSDDDIQAVQAIYGQPSRNRNNNNRKYYRKPAKSPALTTRRSTTTTTTTRSPIRATQTYARRRWNQRNSVPQTSASTPFDICKNPSLDAMITLDNGTTFAFKDKWYWQLDPITLKFSPDQARSIRSSWGVDDGIDAMVSDIFGWNYVFKGRHAWIKELMNHKLVGRGKSPIDSMAVYHHLPGDVHAAMLFRTDDLDGGHAFFFNGPKYWRDADWNGQPDEPFQRSVWEIHRKLHKVDAAVVLPGRGGAYLFSGTEYYKVKEERWQLRAEPGYPRPVGPDWFGC